MSDAAGDELLLLFPEDQHRQQLLGSLGWSRSSAAEMGGKRFGDLNDV